MESGTQIPALVMFDTFRLGLYSSDLVFEALVVYSSVLSPSPAESHKTCYCCGAQWAAQPWLVSAEGSAIWDSSSGHVRENHTDLDMTAAKLFPSEQKQAANHL